MLESTNAEASIWLFFILVFQSEVFGPAPLMDPPNKYQSEYEQQ